MPIKTESQTIMDECCQVGKTITANLTIKDQGLASKLMSTMHNHNVDYFGVSVDSWGLYDIQAAYKRREELIAEENERHYARIKYLNNPNNLRQMLEA